MSDPAECLNCRKFMRSFVEPIACVACHDALQGDIRELRSQLTDVREQCDVLRTVFDEVEADCNDLREENERLRVALQNIATGKRGIDNDHPFGEYAGMSRRFVDIAKRALDRRSAQHPLPCAGSLCTVEECHECALRFADGNLSPAQEKDR